MMTEIFSQPSTRFARQIHYCGDPELEKAIDQVGREKVFQRAAELGWYSAKCGTPKYVWWGIIAEITERELRKGH